MPVWHGRRSLLCFICSPQNILKINDAFKTVNSFGKKLVKSNVIVIIKMSHVYKVVPNPISNINIFMDKSLSWQICCGGRVSGLSQHFLSTESWSRRSRLESCLGLRYWPLKTWNSLTDIQIAGCHMACRLQYWSEWDAKCTYKHPLSNTLPTGTLTNHSRK